jgi:hypothetical protein
MNQKREPIIQSNLLIAGIVATILVAAGIGYLVGKKGQTSTPETRQTPPGEAQTPTPASPTPGTPPPAAPQSNGLSTADLAKAKNVPAVLQDPAGNYQLVAVIEGEEANRKLTSSLQIVGAQRQRLLGLSRQYDQLPAASIQQRELIAGEILKARQTLARNLQFMARNYGYSLQFNYRLVPHAASLLLITAGEDGKPASELVHEFKNAASYERFQKMRDDYLLLSVDEAKKAAAQEATESPAPATPATPAPTTPESPAPAAPNAPPADSTEPSPSPAPSPQPAAPEPSPELKTMQEDLIEEFQYDPTKNHQVNLEKTALYARPGNR